jgi:hypothetical protein
MFRRIAGRTDGLKHGSRSVGMGEIMAESLMAESFFRRRDQRRFKVGARCSDNGLGRDAPARINAFRERILKN